jgi:murein DD-endopeptidase MepM/ murein hydrolase activator NlpD
MPGQRSPRVTLLAIAALLFLSACDSGSSVEPPENGPEPPSPPAGAEVVWPLALTDAPDADSVSFPYGPRALPSRYDFHGGIDLPESPGTPVYSVLPGRVVLVSTWDGSSTGPGNAVLVAHSDDRATSYLHLREIEVAEGDSLELGERLGTVGSTGAATPHLHLGYFVGLPRDTRVRDERLSRNPLELLPHETPDAPTGEFTGSGVVLDVPLQGMTIQSIQLSGQGESRTLDYYEIVARGFTPRDETVQNGVQIGAERPEEGRFSLPLRPLEFAPDRVVVTDFRGEVLLDLRR